MNIKAFFVDALTAALDLKIGTPDDVLRHVTPDVLAAHLPRPLWARLLTACLGAPRIDAQVVVETIGVPNICEHVPTSIMWSCIADIGARALGTSVDVAAPTTIKAASSGRAVLAPPPDVTAPAASTSSQSPASLGPSIPAPSGQPLSDIISELEGDEGRNPIRPRTATSNRFRQSNTGVARGLGANARRPQAQATPATPTPLPRPTGRRGTEVVGESEQQTSVETKDWSDKEIAVDDSQLVDWQTDVGSSTAITGDDDFSDLGRKR
jgi:hypothetical protein